MSEFLQYDPVRGITESMDWDHASGDMTVHRSQDVSGALAVAAETRKRGSADEAGKKCDFYLYATIPAVVEYELLKQGIDIHLAQDGKKMMQVIERDYPYLKMTDKKGWINH